ncbi:MAG: helix-turn-helix domain-containing protein [Spirochaetota bacterium]
METLRIQNISIRSGENLYLDNTALTLQPGKVYGFVSRNPRAIDSFVDILCGFSQPYTGIFYLGKKVISAKELRAKTGIASQTITLAQNMRVYDNIFLGRYSRHSRFGFVSNRTLRTEAEIILSSLATPMDSRQRVRQISDNGQKIIEIARLIVRDPDIMIFNIVTGALSARQYNAVFETISMLKKAGKIIIMIPCGPEDVRSFVDVLYFINNARMTEIADCKDMTSRTVDDIFLSTGRIEETVVNDPILKAKVFFEQHCTEPMLNCQALAQSLGMGYESFRHRFKQETGLSPNQYFLKLKIDRAKNFLIQSTLSIQQVAEKTGFPDPSHFSKLFKEKEKISPAEFRKRAKEGDRSK